MQKRISEENVILVSFHFKHYKYNNFFGYVNAIFFYNYNRFQIGTNVVYIPFLLLKNDICDKVIIRK